MASSKVWTGFIRFGQLNIAVFLNVGCRDSKQITFKTLHSECNTPLNKPYFCSTCDVKVPANEVVKGYESPDGYIRVTQDEINSMAPESEKVMEITDCILWDEVDPLYLAESFYILPEGPGRKAYSLLVKSLQETGRVALAQVCKSNREHLALIRPKGNGLMLHFLWYDNEVNIVPEFENLPLAALTPGEIKLGAKLAESRAAEFDPESFENGFEKRVLQLISSKMDSAVQAPSPVKDTPTTAPVDLMDALRASITAPKPKRAIHLEKAPEKKGKKKKAA